MFKCSPISWLRVVSASIGPIRLRMVYKIDIRHLNNQVDMSDDEIPEDINVHKQIWGKDANQVIYGEVEKKEDDEQRCPICNSRIDEFGYCGCGGKLGVT